MLKMCVGEVGATGMSYYQPLELEPETLNSRSSRENKKIITCEAIFSIGQKPFVFLSDEQCASL